MSFISIALVGLFAFSGALAVPAEAPTTENETLVATSTTIALKDSAAIVRPKKDEAGNFSVLLTAYNAVPEQTDGNPSVTASGAASNPEVVIARSVDLAADLPFGTIVALEREGSDSEGCRYDAIEHLIGYRVVADSMHSRKRNQMDVLLDHTDTVSVHGTQMNPARALGLCKGVTVRVVGRMKISEIPATQAELRKLVEGDKLAMR